MNHHTDSERLQRRVVHRAALSRAAEPSDRLTAGHPGSLFVTVATSTPLPPDQEDAHADKRVGKKKKVSQAAAATKHRQTAAANWPTLATGSLKGSA